MRFRPARKRLPHGKAARAGQRSRANAGVVLRRVIQQGGIRAAVKARRPTPFATLPFNARRRARGRGERAAGVHALRGGALARGAAAPRRVRRREPALGRPTPPAPVGCRVGCGPGRLLPLAASIAPLIELGGLADKLDAAYRRTAAGLADDDAVTIVKRDGKARLKLWPLDPLDERSHNHGRTMADLQTASRGAVDVSDSVPSDRRNTSR